MKESVLQNGLSKPEISQILDVEQWNHVQDLFADVIGVTIYTVNRDGDLVTRPSKMTRLCNELRYSSLFCMKQCVECIKDNIGKFLNVQKVDISCHCGLQNFVIPIIVEENEIIGFLIAGPVLVGGRKNKDDYLELCSETGISPDLYFDALHEIKVFSYKSLNSVVSLLRDAVSYMIKLGYQRSKLEAWLPGFLDLNKANDKAYSQLYFNKLLNSLLDVAMAVTKGESGSVMIFDKEQNEFFVKISRGQLFNDETVQKYPNQIADVIVHEKKGYLINQSTENLKIKDYLKRPDIKSSIVVPIKMMDNVFGVFSVNAHSDHIRFTKSNLNLLNQLGELAAVALSQFNLKEIADVH